MARGRPRKQVEHPAKAEVKEVIQESAPVEKVEEKKEVKLEPLGPGQQYFEAPDGTILVGSSDSTRLFYRAGGIWINPRR